MKLHSYHTTAELFLYVEQICSTPVHRRYSRWWCSKRELFKSILLNSSRLEQENPTAPVWKLIYVHYSDRAALHTFESRNPGAIMLLLMWPAHALVS